MDFDSCHIAKVGWLQGLGIFHLLHCQQGVQEMASLTFTEDNDFENIELLLKWYVDATFQSNF